MKVEFYAAMGYAGCKIKETVEYENDVSDDELQEDFEEWLSGKIDSGFYRIEGEATSE